MLLPSHEKVLYSKFQVSISKTLACRSWTPAPGGGARRRRRQTTRMGLHMKILTTVKKGYAPMARERVHIYYQNRFAMAFGHRCAI